jgi:hypothetical protein
LVEVSEGFGNLPRPLPPSKVRLEVCKFQGCGNNQRLLPAYKLHKAGEQPYFIQNIIGQGMKKYFLQTGIAQEGPFTLEELQAKHLTKETPVWHEGLPGWTKAECIVALKSLLEAMPPRFVADRQAPVDAVSDGERRILSRVMQVVGIIGTIMLLLKEINSHS